MRFFAIIAAFGVGSSALALLARDNIVDPAKELHDAYGIKARDNIVDPAKELHDAYEGSERGGRRKWHRSPAISGKFSAKGPDALKLGVSLM
ncbi:hypothetical protein F5Y09DRAFT_339704 [Xylaria sp. FL1042]|nr:hypothetical protein F5Y09DRAFT_339704 [Xylaria sp. FL1042]